MWNSHRGNKPSVRRVAPRGIRSALLLGLVAGLALWSGASTAHAAPLGTTTTINTCTEVALDSAITSAASGDTITFGCSSDIKLTQTLTISKNLTLDGSGQQVIIDGNNAVQDIVVQSGAQVTLNALTITKGIETNINLGGGGISNGGTLTLTNSTVSGNSVSNTVGGGIYNTGTLTLINSTVSGNTVNYGLGGGICNNAGTLTLINSTVKDNSVTGISTTLTLGGGGIFNSQGRMTLTNSTISGNSVDQSGGGITTDLSTVILTNSTISGNSAKTGYGGGIANVSAPLSLSNTTISDNSASAGRGGGIYNQGISAAATVNTIGSIFAGNPGGNCQNGPSAAITDQGYNLESGSDCGFTDAGSKQNIDPKLATSLADNGGPTETLALLSGSPAIDVIPVASCPSTDQRGVKRPDMGESACDIGAYEFVDPDNDLGFSNVPSDTTIDATSPAGAVLPYTPPTAADESGDDPAATVSCTPASGSTFPIGTTTVACTATDSDDTNSPVSTSFTVTVRGASDQLTSLAATINALGLGQGPQTSFDSQLSAVQTDLASNNKGQACSDLASFVSHVNAQSGKQLTVDQANTFLAAAQQIQAVIGC